MPEWDREVIDDQGRMVSEEAVLDVITSDPQSGRPLHLDVTVTSACPSNPAALRRRARRDGAGAADAAARKRSRYNLASPSLIPLASEDGVGRLRRLSVSSGAVGQQRNETEHLCLVRAKVTTKISQLWPGCGKSSVLCCSGATPS